jgi:hypothetical protein
MKTTTFLALVCSLLLPLSSFRSQAQKVALFSYPVEIELTNDQGDMPTKEYLKNYGTKGKKRGNEFIYQAVTPFLAAHLKKAGFDMLAMDTMASVKENDYGMPSASLSKAIGSKMADEYMKVSIQDITMPAIEGLTPQDANSRKQKLVKIKCRIQIWDQKRKSLKDAEGIFQSGDKIENSAELGVDLRKYQGSEYLQEVKIYETCVKMAILKAIQNLKE